MQYFQSSVCLILELCSFGSMSDIIRGYGFDWNSSHRAPLKLSYTDVLYLALGCARSVLPPLLYLTSWLVYFAASLTLTY
jgi:hypothetical protein